KPGVALNAADWQEMLSMNLLSGVLLAHAAIPHLRSPSGSITFISSIAGLEAIGAPVPYEAAKAALLQATKSLARLLAPQGLLGVEHAAALLDGGATVVLADVREDAAQRAAACLARADAVALDVSKPDSVQHALAWVLERYGKLDILVNNAAIDAKVGRDGS